MKNEDKKLNILDVMETKEWARIRSKGGRE